jgi:hypothetical protein
MSGRGFSAAVYWKGAAVLFEVRVWGCHSASFDALIGASMTCAAARELPVVCVFSKCIHFANTERKEHQYT